MPGREVAARVRCGPDAASALGYLAALTRRPRGGDPAGAQRGTAALVLEGRYDPRYVVTGTDVEVREGAAAHELHRTSRAAVDLGHDGQPEAGPAVARPPVANARSIAEYLGIDAERARDASLPIHYSYGLSVLNTHLLAGARS